MMFLIAVPIFAVACYARKHKMRCEVTLCKPREQRQIGEFFSNIVEFNDGRVGGNKKGTLWVKNGDIINLTTCDYDTVYRLKVTFMSSLTQQTDTEKIWGRVLEGYYINKKFVENRLFPLCNCCTTDYHGNGTGNYSQHGGGYGGGGGGGYQKPERSYPSSPTVSQASEGYWSGRMSGGSYGGDDGGYRPRRKREKSQRKSERHCDTRSRQGREDRFRKERRPAQSQRPSPVNYRYDDVSPVGFTKCANGCGNEFYLTQARRDHEVKWCKYKSNRYGSSPRQPTTDAYTELRTMNEQSTVTLSSRVYEKEGFWLWLFWKLNLRSRSCNTVERRRMLPSRSETRSTRPKTPFEALRRQLNL